MKNVQVLLARRPSGLPQPEDFRVVRSETPEPREGEFLVDNLYLSLDAGFRNWMGEGSGDDILPAMPLDAPVMGLTLGRVCRSRHPEWSEGQLLMSRFAWESFSISDGSDFIVPVKELDGHPLHYHLGILGDTGMSAYFGMVDIARPEAGETALISAAGGAVGSIAGQIAKLRGARTIGLAGSDEKCERLVNELGYDHAVNHRGEDFADQLATMAPSGLDIYFDSVGGRLLEVVLEQINEGARIPFCGAVANYSSEVPIPGPHNLFRLVTQSATLQGYMTHRMVDRYPQARAQLLRWVEEGVLSSVEYVHTGVENAGVAFCDLFAGRNFGKTIVEVEN
jgi:NADPH-dependent curcumin reductase CurA